MIQITDKQQCCGCASCVQKCPKQCISLYEDNEGFLYPQVDKDVCIDCGLCEKVCPILTPYNTREPLQVLAAINKDEKIRMQSSSGGIFTLLAESIIKEGGVVFGARFDDEWQVTLDYTETMEGLAAFRGSKYVQARTGETYKQCEYFLKEDRKVLFTGSPCQIAGLHHYLRKEYENLITCDFVCHGVPSPKVWRLYLKEIIDDANKVITDIQFRNKDNGWKNFNFKFTYDIDRKITTLSSCHRDNIYMRAFLNDMILRPSCYECSTKEGKSKSDISIADFWKIQLHHPDMDDDKGTGLVLIHTDKGKNLIDISKVKYIESNYETALSTNRGLQPTVIPHKKRNKFFVELESTDNLCSLILKFSKPTIKQRFRLLLNLFKHTIQNIICGGGVICKNQESTIYPSIPLDYNSICYITFRDKQEGWNSYKMVIKIK